MVAKEAETGKAYLHAHKDVNGQPVIVIRSSLHVTGTRLSTLSAVALTSFLHQNDLLEKHV